MNTNLNATRILIYGDSITWGRIARQPARYNTDTRFTAVLQNELGDEFEIIEEGLRGRMAKGENPNFQDRDGFKQLPSILSSHLPIDILIIFLGTNDTNYNSMKSGEQITEDLESYIPLIKETSALMGMDAPKKIAFIAPPAINGVALGDESNFKGANEKTDQLPKLIEDMATRNDCLYFDASKVVTPSIEDGIHLDAENNVKLGKALAELLRGQ